MVSIHSNPVWLWVILKVHGVVGGWVEVVRNNRQARRWWPQAGFNHFPGNHRGQLDTTFQLRFVQWAGKACGNDQQGQLFADIVGWLVLSRILMLRKYGQTHFGCSSGLALVTALWA